MVKLNDNGHALWQAVLALYPGYELLISTTTYFYINNLIASEISP